MYSTRSGLILGFHGCDISVAEEVLNKRTILEPSTNNYDWLGHGIYFWDNSPSRALDYATFLSANPGRSKRPIKNPTVLGAVLNLGLCLDLLDYSNLLSLKLGFELLKVTREASGFDLPNNNSVGTSEDLLLRELDCAVIQSLHEVRRLKSMPPFDSVRGVFWEGKELYPNAGFREKDHIQICIRNPNCIKGYFLPRELDVKHPQV